VYLYISNNPSYNCHKLYQIRTTNQLLWRTASVLYQLPVCIPG